MPAIKIIFIID